VFLVLGRDLLLQWYPSVVGVEKERERESRKKREEKKRWRG
jgi:hypothetical protein